MCVCREGVHQVVISKNSWQSHTFTRIAFLSPREPFGTRHSTRLLLAGRLARWNGHHTEAERALAHYTRDSHMRCVCMGRRSIAFARKAGSCFAWSNIRVFASRENIYMYMYSSCTLLLRSKNNQHTNPNLMCAMLSRIMCESSDSKSSICGDRRGGCVMLRVEW